MSAPYGLTVGQLKALLASMPESFEDKIVVLAKDPEGNGFETLSEVAVGFLRTRDENSFHGFVPSDNDVWAQVEAEALRDYLTDEDADEDDEEDEPAALDEFDHPAVCLWP